MTYIGTNEYEFSSKQRVHQIKEGENISIDNTDPKRPIISSTGGGSGDINFEDIGGQATVEQLPIGTDENSVAAGDHTHSAGQISYGNTNVGSALAQALKNGDSGNNLNNLTVDRLTLKTNLIFESAATDAKTKIYFEDAENGINATVQSMQLNFSKEISFNGLTDTPGTNISFNSHVNFRGNLNFQGGAINGYLLWKNADGVRRPIYNHANATDGILTLPKDAGTLARLEDITYTNIQGLSTGNVIIGGASGNEQRKLTPSDFGLTANSFLAKSASDNTFVQIAYRSVANNNSIAQRTATGQLKIQSAIDSDDAVSLNQFQGLTNNTLTASQTSTELNTLYASYPINGVVRSITNNVQYTKISSTQWQKQTLQIV